MASTFSHYELLDKLGKGGMGEVYRARDTRLDRDVAIKVLPDAFAADAERVARFEREAKLLASLSHPNIGAIYGLEEDAGRRALILELIEGENLQERLTRGALPVADALTIAKQIAIALDAAHEQGVVHRDLKPANVVVTEDDTVKVLDFGLAKALDTTGGSDLDLSMSPTILGTGTQHGVVLGTAAYMSPEQAQGKPVDKRADIFAFGEVLFEMLSGRQLFAGGSLSETLASVLRDEPRWGELPKNTPRQIRHLLERCLEKDPKRRFRDIGEACFLIEAAGDTQAPAADEETRSANSRHLMLSGWLATLAVLVFFLLRGYGGDVATDTAAHALSTDRTLSRLTSEAGVEMFPSLSPDGEWITYAARGGEDWDIFLRGVGATRTINLTEDHDGNDTAPAFSPDGRSIVFRSDRAGGGIFVMGRTGESVRRVADSGFNPSWSPDGKNIVVGKEGVVDSPDARASSQVNLVVVDVESGTSTEIDVDDGVQPDWSPNGHRIAYWGLHPNTGQRDIYTCKPDGSDPRSVLEDAPTDWNPTWSPDGSFIYFSSNRSGQMGIWRISIDERTGIVRGAPEPVTFGGSAAAYHISFASERPRMLFVEKHRSANVWRYSFDVQTGTMNLETREQLTWGTKQTTFAAPSPDSEWLAYVDISRSQEDLYVMRMDGSQLRRLTDDTFKNRLPRWSPDGTEILFYSDRGGTYDLWIIRPDGSGLRQVSDENGVILWGIWNLDGSKIYGTNVLTGTILEFDITKGPGPYPSKPLETKTPWVLATSFSSDGRMLAVFGGDQPDGPTRIGMLDIETMELTLFGPGFFPIMAGNEWLLCLDETEALTATNIGSGDIRRLTHTPVEIDPAIGVSKDLNWIYMSITESESDVWLMEWPE